MPEPTTSAAPGNGDGQDMSDGAINNVLFIMCDQLRWDALSCCGGAMDTPNIDALAARGVRFDGAYVNGMTCGSSRMSYYTGRYVQTHGSRYNRVPLRIDQKTMGDHLRALGVRTALAGKTHNRPDLDGMARLGLSPDDPECIFLAECGFEASVRDDGLHPDFAADPELAYNRFLREHGFEGPNPWHTAANSVRDENGEIVSGWLMRASKYPSIVPDELSETAFLTDRAIDFVREARNERWCLHLSYIKPHWPYVVSSPWQEMFDAADVPPAHRIEAELETDHPVLAALRKSRIGRTMSRDEVRRSVIPTYLGMVAQIDHHLGRLFAELDSLGLTDETMVVLCSDHGDYLGDHWQGEKDWFHEEAARIPLIIADPRSTADATRGSADPSLVQAIDLLPTFVEAVGGDVGDCSPWLEGQSLAPRLTGTGPAQEQVVSEADYAFLEAINYLPPTDRTRDFRATMIRTDRYKYILCDTAPNLLYDLHDDPDEFVDRAGDPALAAVQSELHERLFDWYRRRAHDTSYDDDFVHPSQEPGGPMVNLGVSIGYWDEADVELGRAGKNY